MKDGYKLLGGYIRQVDVRNTEGREDNLLGVSVQKKFISSIANTVGTDFTKYKVVKKGQFTYIPDTSRRGDKIGIALLSEYDEGLVSNVYTVFEVIDETLLLPEYLMLWFSRPEFDRYARFKSHGSVREVMDWEEMCKVELPVPSIDRQKAIVKAYKTITDRIELKRKINDNLEAESQSIYQKMFVDNPDSEDWNRGKVGDVLQLQRGHDLPRTEMLGGQYPVAGSTGTIGFHDTFTTKAPAIVMGRSGNIGNPRLYFSDCWAHNTSLYVKQVFSAEVFWVFFMLKNLNYDGFVGGSAVPTLNRNDVHAYEIVIPPIDLQKVFSKQVRTLILFTEENKKELQLLGELQNTMLTSLSSR